MTEDVPPEGTLSAPTRIVAGVAGALVLLVSALMSVGSSLLAPLGVLAAGAIARRNGSRATRATTWVGAIIASMGGIVLGAALVFAVLPADVRQEFRTGLDSAQTVARSQQVEELARRGIDPAVADRIANPSPTFSIWFAILGGMLAVAFFGAMAGSAGWAATFLIAGAFSGRWPWRGEPAPSPSIAFAGPA